MKFEPGFQEAIITSAKREVKDSRSSGITLGSRGYFFLIDTDGSRRSRVNEAQSAEEKKILLGAFFFFALTRLQYR